jgi:transposase
MEAKREAIVALLHAELPVSDIVKQISVSRATVFNVKRRLKESGHVKRKPGSGRKPTVTNPKLVEAVRSRLRRNPVRTMRGMAKELKVSEHTIRNIVKKKIKALSLARSKRFLLTDRLRSLRLERCKRILAMMKKRSPVILFTDEKYFSVDQVCNSRSDRYITKLRVQYVPDKVRTVNRTKHPSQLMMFGLVASNGLKMPPVFLEKGFRMGAKDYLDRVLKPYVLPWIQQNFQDQSELIFMQDGAPCHTSKLAVGEPEFLAKRGLATQLTGPQPSGLLHLGVCSGKGLQGSAPKSRRSAALRVQGVERHDRGLHPLNLFHIPAENRGSNRSRGWKH